MANVLIISDTHFPWNHPNYLEFCKETYERFNCDRIVHIGDVVDAYAFSFYDSNPEAISMTEELSRAEVEIKKWAEAFPKMHITLGNHTKRCAKRLVGAKLPKRLWPSYNKIFGAPKAWKFVEDIEIDGVLYRHGEQGDARKTCLIEQQSVVSGHSHTKMGIDFHTNRKGKKIWGMQVGTGIDWSAYVFDYSRHHKPPQLGAGVVIDGKHPIIVPFNPKDYQ